MNSTLQTIFHDSSSTIGRANHLSVGKQYSSTKLVIQSYTQLVDYTSASSTSEVNNDENEQMPAHISLSLYAFTFSNAKWSKFLTILKFHAMNLTNRLVFLDLACCNLTNLHAEQIFYNVEFPVLQVLILSGNLLTALPYQQGVTSTAQQYNDERHTSTAVAHQGMSHHLKSKGILTTCPSLQVLILRNNLLSSLSGFMHQLCVHKSLHELDLSCNTRVDVGQLGYALMVSKAIRKLNLAALGLKSKEMPSLMEVCLFTNLSHLNLWCNDLDEAFARNMRDCFMMNSSQGGDSRNGSSSTIQNGANAPSSSTHHHHLATQLEHLNLGMNQLGDGGAIYLADLLREQQSFNPTSSQKQMRSTHSSAASNGIIHLKTLDLSSNHISAKGAQALSSSLMLNSHLQSLNLSDNQLNAQDCEVIIKSTQNHHKLHFVNLSRNFYSEREMTHLNAVANQFASQVHFKFQPAEGESGRISEESAAHETLIQNVDKHINAKYHTQKKSKERPPSPPPISDHEIDQLVNRSLMETITSELQKKSTIRSPVGMIPVAQNTFDDSEESIHESPEKNIPQPRRDAIPEPDIHIERVVSVSREEIDPDTNKSPSRHLRSKKQSSSSSRRKKDGSQSLQPESKRPPGSHLTEIEEVFQEEIVSVASSVPSDDDEKEPSELNTFLNEIFELKKIADMNSPKRGSFALSSTQASDSVTNVTPRHASFSQKRSQFFEVPHIQDAAQSENEVPHQKQTSSGTAPAMSFLGMLKKRGLLSENENLADPSGQLSQEIATQQKAASQQEVLSSKPLTPAEEIRTQEKRKRFSADWSQQMQRDQPPTTRSPPPSITAPSQPPESLLQLLRQSESQPPPSPTDSAILESDHALRSPLLAFGGKRTFANSPPLADDGQHDLSIESPPSPFQIAGAENDSSAGTPITPLTPVGGSDSDEQGKSHSTPLQNSGANRFKSSVNAVIATARFQSMSFKAKSLATRTQTKKKIDVQITEDGQMLVQHQPSKGLFGGKSKTTTLYTIQIAHELKTKALSGKRLKICNADSAFVLNMKTKDQTELMTALRTIQRKLEKEKQEAAEEEARHEKEKQKTGSEKKLLLNPFCEYVRGIRPFKSQGDNRLDVEVDALYKVEGRVNGWLFVSLVKDGAKKGYVLPQDVMTEDTSQYSFGT
mmetsp:Transcript_10656/g.39775  ORF Transcript_10656/g.39775 Transcript_10656/m.39775 type:complete len:1164 (-) Transcript_10656:2096-5587(-)|eukprot:CAMPEP_0117444584 /NCGR_PEP_ID=MMETSP0759-20121206/5318_1 /TAXON_ID=63605 /ORGANISM="Percolomonas cosmopolitus, Strain WS" /LENGTH=1163 /DNA_ID=CAMNT_0005236659 /DNA_START=150 /DNA_END=3641 /DNA_ORIENTATION=-